MVDFCSLPSLVSLLFDSGPILGPGLVLPTDDQEVHYNTALV